MEKGSNKVIKKGINNVRDRSKLRLEIDLNKAGDRSKQGWR